MIVITLYTSGKMKTFSHVRTIVNKILLFFEDIPGGDNILLIIYRAAIIYSNAEVIYNLFFASKDPHLPTIFSTRIQDYPG